jgi:hypothetical protein
MSHAGHRFKIFPSPTENHESLVKELIEVRENFNQIQIQLANLRQMFDSLDLFTALMTPIQEVKREITECRTEFKEIQVDLRGLRRIVTQFYTEEVIEHQREIEACVQEIKKQKFEFSLRNLQSEITIETLRTQSQKIQTKYQGENLRSAIQLQFRINELQGGTSDPETLKMLDELITRLNTVIHPSWEGENQELEPNSPMEESRTYPATPRLTSQRESRSH